MKTTTLTKKPSKNRSAILKIRKAINDDFNAMLKLAGIDKSFIKTMDKNWLEKSV